MLVAKPEYGRKCDFESLHFCKWWAYQTDIDMEIVSHDGFSILMLLIIFLFNFRETF